MKHQHNKISDKTTNYKKFNVKSKLFTFGFQRYINVP